MDWHKRFDRHDGSFFNPVYVHEGANARTPIWIHHPTSGVTLFQQVCILKGTHSEFW